MFCPKCSRPLAAGVQFCQQCVLALGGVRGALASAGEVEGDVARPGTRGPASRRKGVRQGFMLAALAVLLLPFYPVVEGLADWLVPSVENTRLDELPMELFGAALLVLFITGVVRMLYAWLSERGQGGAAPGEGEEEQHLRGRQGGRALPPSQSIPAEDYFAGHSRTADPANPPSVTEHTTRSLRRD